MNQLLEKLNEYKTIVNYRMEYTFDDETVIDFKLKQTDFPHLIGLHKLIDIPVIRQFNDKKNMTVSAKYLLSKIKKQSILTEEIVRNSRYFPEIEMRFENFSRETLLTMSYTDVIIDFNPVLIASNLKAKYILYEQKNQHSFNYLCIAENGDTKRYVESFFYNPTDLYIRNQITMKVKQMRVYDSYGKLYVEDVF